MGSRAWSGAFILLIAGGLAGRVSADVVTLGAAADNTLYQDAAGALSNGAGQHLFTGDNDNSERRRAVLRFDLAGQVPPGAVVTAVELRLQMSRTQAGATPVALHRLLAGWGEGASDAGGEEGGGTAAVAPDATWLHTTFPSARWTTAGGDYLATASATASVAGPGPYTWGNTAGMVADVQAWVDGAAPNDGWILIGSEVGRQTAKRFDSRTHPTAANRPQLVVTFTPPASGACCDGSGACAVTAPSACTGSYQGDGTACGAGGRCGACCDGPACALAIDANCTAYSGDGTTCTPDPCLPPPTGACCLGATCSDGETRGGCAARGGIYQGDGQTCATNPCDAESRACCLGPDNCVVMNRDQCDAMGGDRLGGGSTCANNPCAPSGACCLLSGCVDGLDYETCDDQGGFYWGGASCAASPCATGCDAGLIAPIERLLAVKRGADVHMVWNLDPSADGYNVWFVDLKSEIPSAKQGGPGAILPGCSGRAMADCTHAGAVAPASGTLLFYNVLGSCGGVEAAR